jgi:hypothetical protein
MWHGYVKGRETLAYLQTTIRQATVPSRVVLEMPLTHPAW